MNISYSQLAEMLLNDGNCFKICVIGDSMSPLLRTGDAIYVEPVKADNLSIGDIILSKAGEKMRAHRLIKIYKEKGGGIFRTKGDTFSSVDEPLGENNIIGRVYAVEKWGKTLNLKMGIFSRVDKLLYFLSSLTSFLYNIRRYLKHLT